MSSKQWRRTRRGTNKLILYPKRYSSFPSNLKTAASVMCSVRSLLLSQHTLIRGCQCRCLPKTVDQDSVWANARWPSQVLSACELFLVLPLSLLLPNPSSRDRLLFLSGHRLRTSFHSKYGKDYLLKFCFPCHFISRSNRSCRMKHSQFTSTELYHTPLLKTTWSLKIWTSVFLLSGQPCPS